jgi:hypothetical protein
MATREPMIGVASIHKPHHLPSNRHASLQAYVLEVFIVLTVFQTGLIVITVSFRTEGREVHQAYIPAIALENLIMAKAYCWAPSHRMAF